MTTFILFVLIFLLTGTVANQIKNLIMHHDEGEVLVLRWYTNQNFEKRVSIITLAITGDIFVLIANIWFLVEYSHLLVNFLYLPLVICIITIAAFVLQIFVTNPRRSLRHSVEYGTPIFTTIPESLFSLFMRAILITWYIYLLNVPM